jgi:hypothetical protein
MPYNLGWREYLIEELVIKQIACVDDMLIHGLKIKIIVHDRDDVDIFCN